VNRLDYNHTGCDACHISGRISTWQSRLEGYPYDPETHQPIETDSEEEEDRKKKEKLKAKRRLKRRQRASTNSSEVPSDTSDEELPRLFHMGRFCKARANVYHSMSHWGESIFCKERSTVDQQRISCTIGFVRSIKTF